MNGYNTTKMVEAIGNVQKAIDIISELPDRTAQTNKMLRYLISVRKEFAYQISREDQ